jgi:hypothetical protein
LQPPIPRQKTAAEAKKAALKTLPGSLMGLVI